MQDADDDLDAANTLVVGQDSLLGDGADSPPDAVAAVAVPGFEIVRTLGKGGMGMVYLARQQGVLERDVALKTILPKHEDEVFRSYFLREGRRQAKLHHPNILPIFAAGEAGDLLYLSVYYARDGSLRDRMEANALTLPRAVEIVGDVLAALHHAHCELDVPMAHLDVKPENILFDGDNVFLADFGIAKILAEEGTMMGVVAGDPRYWPPEQQIDKATTKSDIYALGVMFFEMLCGERPAPELRSITTLTQQKALARQLPAEARVFAPLIARCLNPNMAARPDAADLAAELKRLTSPRPPLRRVASWVFVVLALGIGISQPAARDAIRERWSTMFPLPQHPAAFSLSPENSQLWIDGQAEPLRNLRLSEGEHRVVAVAANHIGETVLLEVDNRGAEVSFDLVAQPPPDDEELQRFINSFDGSDTAHDMTWREPTLINVVTLDRLEDDDARAFEDRVEELQALAAAGDAVAATSLFYAAFEGIGVPDGPKKLMQGLVVASDDGYAMASLLRALYVVQSLLEAEETFNNNPYAFAEVESLLRRAAQQGLPETAARVASVAGIRSLDEAITAPSLH